MENEIKQGKYKHYKGRYYQVIGEAIHSETLEKLVIYKALYNSKNFGKNSIWVRPKKMFLEKIIIKGKKIPRFKLINN
ncbi:MAG: DUF1653 domain-containing protein [Parcubacteria group bacterium]|nr:DUF1653 domain-containing protein [Parcubacteria group bacterium]